MNTMLLRATSIGILVALFGLLLPAASPIKADTLYTNLGSGYSSSDGFAVGYFSPGDPDEVVASPFVASETATLTDAQLVLSVFSGSPSVNVYIESDVAGTPGTILDTLTQTETLGNAFSLVEFTCSTCSTLTAGTEYFLVAQNPVAGSTANWSLANGAIGTLNSNEIGSATGPWQEDPDNYVPAFEVDGGVNGTVPEPSSIFLLGIGLLGILAVGGSRLKRSSPAA
jgi:PEP-CTERM motif